MLVRRWQVLVGFLICLFSLIPLILSISREGQPTSEDKDLIMDSHEFLDRFPDQSLDNTKRPTTVPPSISFREIENIVLTGASRMTGSVARDLLDDLTSPDGRRILVPNLIESEDPWLRILGIMAIMRSNRPTQGLEFELFVHRALSESSIDELVAVSVLADWMWMNGYFEEWNDFLVHQVVGLTPDSAYKLLQFLRRGKIQVPAVFFHYGSDSFALNRLVVEMASRSDLVTNAILGELAGGQISKHWQNEYWSYLSKAGFPGEINHYYTLLTQIPNSPQKTYANHLIDCYQIADSIWEELNSRGSLKPSNVFRSANWLMENPYIIPARSELIELISVIEQMPQDRKLNRVLSHLNYLIEQSPKIQ